MQWKQLQHHDNLFPDHHKNDLTMPTTAKHHTPTTQSQQIRTPRGQAPGTQGQGWAASPLPARERADYVEIARGLADPSFFLPDEIQRHKGNGNIVMG
jgi:hypothetical protein